ncbi:MAG: SIMPL domain-containing protein [Candidatus Paceibacterota bacterium]
MRKKTETVSEKINLKNDKNFFDNDFLRLLISVLLFFSIFFVYAYTQKLLKGGDETGNQNVNAIYVNKTESVYISPNVGFLNLTSRVEDKTISEALRKNSERVANLVVFLKNSGISKDDIKTEAFEVYPRYEYTRIEDSSTGSITEGKRTIAGYEVVQSTSVKVRDLNKVGSIIDGAAEIGINNIGDLTFVAEDDEKIKSEAREKAIDSAKAEAQNIANKLGVEIEGISGYNESFSAFAGSMSYDKAVANPSPVTVVEQGKNKIDVTVNISFKIK